MRKNNKSLVGKPVLVEWGDAWSAALEYVTPKSSELADAIPVKTVGFLQSLNTKGVLVSDSLQEDGEGRGPFFIPRGMLRRIVELKEGR